MQFTKKCTLLILIVFLFSTVIVPVTANVQLSDIKGAECEDAVTHLIDLGIISGYPDGTFKPNDSITRAAFAKIIVIALGNKEQADTAVGTTNFTDVPKSHWATGFINVASQQGLIKGSNGKYRPEDKISYSEVLTILLRALGYGSMIESAGKWPDNYLAKAKDLDLIRVTWSSSAAYANRGHAAILTWAALNTCPYQSYETLLALTFPGAQGVLSVHFLDVGQADCILITTPDHKAMLIDAGNNGDASFITNYIRLQGITRLDYVVGTHPHEDHVGSLDTVITAFDVGKVYLPDVVSTTQTFEDVLNAINNKGLKITRPVAGQSFQLGGAVFTILAPISPYYEEVNDYSIVLRMEYGSTSFLFTGDAEELVENEILASGRNIKADVLKVGHHGSTSSSSLSFLNKVFPASALSSGLPRYAVVSVGANNTYGHPDSSIINRIKAMGLTVLRTDVHGTVVISSDGKKLSVVTGKIPAAPSATPSPTATPRPSPSATPAVSGVFIESVDLSAEIVTIKNTGSVTVNLTGWKLVSVVGNQVYNFPSGFMLKAGARVSVVSGSNTADGVSSLKWTGSYIWNNDGDPAQLFDSHDVMISSK